MIRLKQFRQTPDFCGPAALKMVFDYYGIEATEREIGKISGTTKKYGTSPESMEKTAAHFGFEAILKTKGTLNDLKHYLDRKIPVIVNWFWEDDGHYSVVVGMDKKNIVMRDPSFWRIRKMPTGKFQKVWFDFKGDERRPEGMVSQLMIVITPKTLTRK